jgi:hypothetical protein
VVTQWQQTDHGTVNRRLFFNLFQRQIGYTIDRLRNDTNAENLGNGAPAK